MWEYDAYGSLLTDGSTQYTYDAANRLSSITTASGTTTYGYNGDNDRISQSVNGTLTTYILDIATPLTMALSETNASTGETTHYWHALDVLAQSDGTTIEYFAYDGLGSVRQLVDETGSVGLAQTFDPYGNGYAKAGSAKSSFGYSGEQIDGNGFVYLRARYYNPSAGRFFQMDPSRAERNPYQYGLGNPVNRVDPSGFVADPANGPMYGSYGPTEAEEAMNIIRRIDKKYGIKVTVDFGWIDTVGDVEMIVFYEYGLYTVYCGRWAEGQWTLKELYLVEQAIGDMVAKFAQYGKDGRAMFHEAMRSPKIVQKEAIDPLRSHYNPLTHTVVMEPSSFSGDLQGTRSTIHHEFGHAWNWRTGQRAAAQMRMAVGEGPNVRCSELGCVREPATEPPGDELNRNYLANPHEDWANSFAAFVLQDPRLFPYTLDAVRRSFIDKEMRNISFASWIPTGTSPGSHP